MQIERVKDLGHAYLLNGSISVPKAEGNKDYQSILLWIESGGVVEPRFTLDELKSNKKSQVKLNRDAANLRPMVSIQADEIIYADGVFSRTSNKKYFSFSVEETNQPATSPSSIIFSTLLAGAANPSYYLRYSCWIVEGEERRKGYVAIDRTVSTSIQSHMALRATGNISKANELEDLIDLAGSEEELEEINIEF